MVVSLGSGVSSGIRSGGDVSTLNMKPSVERMIMAKTERTMLAGGSG
jgi:hypothetical protein